MVSAEKAEEEVKAAADAINEQLPKEAQDGSMQPLVEEKEEAEEAQPLNTFSSEIDSFDTVTQCCSNDLFAFCLLPLPAVPAMCLSLFALFVLPLQLLTGLQSPVCCPSACSMISVSRKAYVICHISAQQFLFMSHSCAITEARRLCSLADTLDHFCGYHVDIVVLITSSNIALLLTDLD